MNSYKSYDHLNIANPRRGHKTIRPSDRTFLSLLLFWILPFIAVNVILFLLLTAQPKFTVTVDDPGDYKTALVTVKVDSIFPNSGVSATLTGEPFELTEGENRTYTGTATSNGTLEVEVRNKNNMNKILRETISCIDDAPPTIVQGDCIAGLVSLYLDDAQSGVDFGSVYGVDSTGKTISPSLIDEGEALVVFEFDTPGLEVHASDKVGKETVATFSTDSVSDIPGNVIAEDIPAAE